MCARQCVWSESGTHSCPSQKGPIVPKEGAEVRGAGLTQNTPKFPVPDHPAFVQLLLTVFLTLWGFREEPPSSH